MLNKCKWRALGSVCHRPIISSVLGKLGQEDDEFKTSLGSEIFLKRTKEQGDRLFGEISVKEAILDAVVCICCGGEMKERKINQL